MDTKFVVLDPGHGGSDSGSVGTGKTFEKDLTLQLALNLRARFQKYYTGIEVDLTRDYDTYVSLEDRVLIANGPPAVKPADLFVSLHFNGFIDEDAQGMETFTSHYASQVTFDMQQIIHKELYGNLKPFGIRDRVAKCANYYVLRETKMPAILVEPCFITNPRERELVLRSDFQAAITKGLANGIVKALEIDQQRYQVITDPLDEKKANEVLQLLATALVPAHKENI